MSNVMGSVALAGLVACAPAVAESPPESLPAPATFSPSAQSGPPANPFANPLKGDPQQQREACANGPLAAFGRYVGAWTFVDHTIAPDGSWTTGQGGDWDFHCLGAGQAVIDLWQPRAGGFGATVRMFDAKRDRWDVVFTGEGSRAMSHLVATELSDGSIEMHYVQPAHDPARRITFSPPRPDGFDWTMAISRDGGDSWTDVYRMEVRPRFAGAPQ